MKLLRTVFMRIRAAQVASEGKIVPSRTSSASARGPSCRTEDLELRTSFRTEDLDISKTSELQRSPSCSLAALDQEM